MIKIEQANETQHKQTDRQTKNIIKITEGACGVEPHDAC